MKKHFCYGLLVILCLAMITGKQAYAQLNDNQEEQPQVKLSEQQKSELDALYQEAFEARKKIIDKYVEFGVITKEKAEKKQEHMDKFYEELKENDYIPKFHHKGHRTNKNCQCSNE